METSALNVSTSGMQQAKDKRYEAVQEQIADHRTRSQFDNASDSTNKAAWKKKKAEFMKYMMTMFQNRMPGDNFDLSEMMSTFGTIFTVNASYEGQEAIIDLRNMLAKQKIMEHGANVGKFAEMASETVEGGEGKDVAMVFDVDKDAKSVLIRIKDVKSGGNRCEILHELTPTDIALGTTSFKWDGWDGQKYDKEEDKSKLKPGLFSVEILPHSDKEGNEPIMEINPKNPEEKVVRIDKPTFINKITAIYNTPSGILVGAGRATVAPGGIVAISDTRENLTSQHEQAAALADARKAYKKDGDKTSAAKAVKAKQATPITKTTTADKRYAESMAVAS